MEHNHKFSIIVPHYDRSITDKLFIRGMECLLNQTFKNFEVLIFHDGPPSRPIPNIYKKFPNVKTFETKLRENNWGHGNRDRGIKMAKGEYIIHFNPDNILYPDALEEINRVAELPYTEYPGLLFDKRRKALVSNRVLKPLTKEEEKDFKIYGSNNIIIFPIYMIGHFRFGLYSLTSTRVKKITNQKYILTGDPAIKYNIDCLQLVMKRELWLSYGSWYDKSEQADAIMYPKFVHENGARYCSKILGEHW